jgi:hypothetical protein
MMVRVEAARARQNMLQQQRSDEQHSCQQRRMNVYRVVVHFLRCSLAPIRSRQLGPGDSESEARNRRTERADRAFATAGTYARDYHSRDRCDQLLQESKDQDCRLNHLHRPLFLVFR